MRILGSGWVVGEEGIGGGCSWKVESYFVSLMFYCYNREYLRRDYNRSDYLREMSC